MNKETISEKILNKAKRGQIKMKPKIYFILKTVLFALLFSFAAIFFIFLISFIIFNLKMSGVWFLPEFGFGKIGIFLFSLPWFLILIALILIIILEILFKKFSFGYRRPILYSVLGILIVSVLISFAVLKTQMHDNFFLKAKENKLPLAGKLYRDFGAPRLMHIHNGVISELTKQGFFFETTRGEILSVIVSFDLDLNKIEEGKRVVIVGKRDNGIIRAINIKEIDFHMPSYNFRPRHGNMK